MSNLRSTYPQREINYFPKENHLAREGSLPNSVNRINKFLLNGHDYCINKSDSIQTFLQTFGRRISAIISLRSNLHVQMFSINSKILNPSKSPYWLEYRGFIKVLRV